MSTETSPIDLLRARGFIQDVTDEDALRELFATERVTYYVGFDPTAPSLHVGNLVGIMAMAWLQRLGHRPIAIVGGATGRIGDPSGRDSERELLDEATIADHLARFRAQLSRYFDLSSPDAGLVVDNHDWLGSIGFLEFLRDVGKHFSVNQMIARESVKKRLEDREQGISFTEFSYQLLQSYDFAHLYEAEGCKLQGGGSDQWGNITAGTDLVRRMYGAQVYGMVWPLLTTADGKKFGKSAGNAVWLDAGMTSPYAYYQYWMNATDDDAVRFLKMFTFLDLDEIAQLETAHQQDPSARIAHRRLAEEATRIVHGDEGVEEAQRATAVLFGDEPFSGLDDRTLSDAFAAAPSLELTRDRLGDLGLLELMTQVGAAKSNGEARRLVDGGGVRLNNSRVDDPGHTVTGDDLATDTTLVMRVGKKRYFVTRFV